MNNPLEVIQLKTVVDYEERIDPETNEVYQEEIIIEKDKRIKTIIDLDEYSVLEEHIDEHGVIYKGRVVLKDRGGNPILIAKSYDEIKDLLVKNTHKHIGFHGSKRSKEKTENSDQV
jgi:hypothetical protein